MDEQIGDVQGVDLESLALIGEITAPFGIRGEVKVTPFLDRIEWLTKQPFVLIRRASGRWERERVQSLRRHHKAVLVEFAGFDRNKAETMRSVQLFLPKSDFPALPEGEYYEWQLRGLHVLGESGVEFGKIIAVHFNAVANDVYETEIALIPAIESVVLRVDLDAKMLIVREIAGLRKDEL